MDGTVNGRTGELWLCKKGDGAHALGLRIKVRLEGVLVDQLMLFRNAVMPQFAATEARVFGTAEGTQYEIECDLCGAKRTWWIGNGAKRRIAGTYLAE